MFKKNLFLSYLCLLPICSYASIPTLEDGNLQVGRYRMVSATWDKGIVQLYLLDKATVYVWRSTCQDSWFDHDSWQLQIGKTPQ